MSQLLLRLRYAVSFFLGCRCVFRLPACVVLFLSVGVSVRACVFRFSFSRVCRFPTFVVLFLSVGSGAAKAKQKTNQVSFSVSLFPARPLVSRRLKSSQTPKQTQDRKAKNEKMDILSPGSRSAKENAARAQKVQSFLSFLRGG